MRVLAHAKVNLSLRLRPPRRDGLHPLNGLFTSVSWSDELVIDTAAEDRFGGPDGAPVPEGPDNLAWRAVQAVREAAGSRQRLAVELRKRIPVASGLGGGSADAAAALAVTARLLGLPGDAVAELAPTLGSDVPFCLQGGCATVAGVGEQVSSHDPLSGFALAIVVPPAEVATGDVYRAWDRLGGPEGPVLAARELPPVLRDHAPLANDLTAAAVAVAPVIAEWRTELAALWGRAVVLSGSGAALFGYFVDHDEAAAALDAVPAGSRAAEAVEPTDRGWVVVEE
jgi:4-diphosphocytidyl-2-C-methyl-D-erythritol kinase